MQSILENLYNSIKTLDVLYLVLAVLGILATIYTFRISRSIKKPYFDIKSDKLFENKLTEITELKTYFNNEEINKLTSTQIAFWNGGYEVINDIDVAPKDLVRIVINKDSKVLKVNLKMVKNPINNFRIIKSNEENVYFIDFDFFAKNEGCIIEVLHTGKIKDITLAGTIKGSQKILHSPVNRKYFIDTYILTYIDKIVNGILHVMFDYLPSWLSVIPTVISVLLLLPIIGLSILISLPKLAIVTYYKFLLPKEFIFEIKDEDE